MKIAVIGGGIFGVTAANKLAQKGYEIDLFEKNKDILQAASGINQYRLHRGYHYPRSEETIKSCNKSAPVFEKEYAEAIISNAEHHYCIAKQDSFVSGEKFLEICKENTLPFDVVDVDVVNSDNIDVAIKAQESLIDVDKLRKICWDRLKENKINIFLNRKASKEELEKYDYVVIATYANINPILDDTGTPEAQRRYQFELCEKPILKLPESFKNKSIVIMDGPFMCIDPFGDTGLFLMGNVVHAIHATNIGEVPVFDKKFEDLLDRGVVKNPSITNFPKFIESAKKFFPEIEKAEHVGSMYTIRTVLPYHEDTDGRPTIVKIINDKVITVFSGKIGTCVEAAEDIVSLIDSQEK